MSKSRLTVSRHDYARLSLVDDDNELSGELGKSIVVPTDRMAIHVVARRCRVSCADENSGTRREFEPGYPDEAKRQPMIPCRMNEAQYEGDGYRRTELTTATVSTKSVLSKLHKQSCLDLRQLAALHGVDAADETLSRAVADLRRRGKIARIGGRGARASFVLATFES